MAKKQIRERKPKARIMISSAWASREYSGSNMPAIVVRLGSRVRERLLHPNARYCRIGNRTKSRTVVVKGYRVASASSQDEEPGVIF